MQTYSDEIGIITAFIQHLKSDAIPRANAIKLAVDNGAVLNELDIQFFEAEFSYADSVMHLISNHPEYLSLASMMTKLYHEITTKALNNQNASQVINHNIG